ncbi:hypothetical protein EXN66_Car001457 [Channa argus]|uniref:Uncharacterized protein n=2 Tax=Channa argus TaxID=215402 RepID=A0A6G1R119_CHAAH|nr:hypothetical protein EXN66_Car001457 [Channa argus]
MSWGVEVEPPEDMDETLYDIDPRKKIWIGMTGIGLDKHPLKAKEAEIPNLDALPAADIQTEASQEDITYNKEPEEDRDNIDHPVFSNVALEEPEQNLDEVYEKEMEELIRFLAPLTAEYKAGSQLHVGHSQPEMDEDDQYHHEDELHHQDNQNTLVQTEPLKHEVQVHLLPEEDMDALYHKDFPELILYQVDAEPDASVYFPSQRKYSEPEEDLDGVYHQ